MNYFKVKKTYQIAFIICNFLLILTMFIPSLSLDKYVEYDFNYGYYNESYQSYVIPIATKITPYDVICGTFASSTDYYVASNNYEKLKEELSQKLLNGEITEHEYNTMLANSKITSKHMAYSLHSGQEKDLSRLKNKTFLYSMILLVFYILLTATLLVNIINFFKQTKILAIANVFSSWISVVLYIIFLIYTFSIVVPFTNNIAGFNGTIMEEITICMSPKWFCVLVITILLSYGIAATILDRIDTKIDKRNKEIPLAISTNISNKNKYRKINSKKSKYKHGSKKKRHR